MVFDFVEEQGEGDVGDEVIQFVGAGDVEDVDNGAFESKDFLQIKPIRDSAADQILVDCVKGVLDHLQLLLHLRPSHCIRHPLPIPRLRLE